MAELLKDINLREFYRTFDGNDLNETYSEFQEMEVDGLVETLITKIEVLLCTDKKDILGEPDCGCNLGSKAFEIIPIETIKKEVEDVLYFYCPELSAGDGLVSVEVSVEKVDMINNFSSSVIINVSVKNNASGEIYTTGAIV